jgi:hypothetical protein
MTGMAIGNRSHVGNFGVSANLFFTKNIGIRVSCGVGPFNYLGGVISIGPEYSFFHSQKGFVSIGSTWSYFGGGSDILGDDDSNDYVWYSTSSMKSLKFYGSYSLKLEAVFLTLEAGYSHNLTDYSYSFSGPGTATQKQHDSIKRRLSSGWMATVYLNVPWSLKK